MASLSVIVPATDSPGTLPRCLAAIREAVDSPEEVIVVERPAHAGPAEARNTGAEKATGDILVFVDADVVVHADALSRLRAAFEADPGLTALFGSYDDAPEAPGVVSAFRNLLHHHVHQNSPGAAATFWAGLGAVRRHAFLAVGGFDARRFSRPSVEDIEFGMRLCASGGRIVLDPEIQGTHLKGWTLGQMLRVDFLDRGVPWVALLLRDGSRSNALNLGWRHRLSALASLGFVALIPIRRTTPIVVMAGSLIALNHSFYALLVRRRGAAEAAAGIGLHVLHHLTAVAAVPVGLLVHLREMRAR